MTPAILVNVAGFFLGAVLYGMLLVMALGPGTAAASPAWSARLRSRSSRLVILTGLLGLLWNLGEFTAWGFDPTDSPGTQPVWLLISAFTALGFLPAVVVHSVLTRNEDALAASGPRVGPSPLLSRVTVALAYTLSTAAFVMHLAAGAAGRPVPSTVALTVLTAGFACLMLVLLISTRGRQHEGRAIWVVALSVFAVSALHLTQHTSGESWWMEVLGHHASLPLALAILNRDYRFALADIFLKRALTLTLLVGVVLAVHATLGVRWLADVNPHPNGAPLAAYLLALALLATWLHDALRRLSARFVDSVLLRRPDYERLRTELAESITQQEDETELTSVVSHHLVGVLDATWVEVQRVDDALSTSLANTIVLVGADAAAVAPRLSSMAARSARAGALARALTDSPPSPDVPSHRRPHAIVFVPTVESPHYAFLVGQLLGGRRLLSDDLDMLRSIALVTARRLDALRVAHERFEASLREQQISRLATEAELRALRAQLNPHFLFNALTTIGYLIQTAPTRATETLLRLTSLLRSVLRRTTNEFGTLGDELDLIESYLEIEQARFEERLRVTIDVPAALRTLPLPALLLQPLVENAVKHGIAPSRTGGDVVLAAFIEHVEHDAQDRASGTPAVTDQLRISVRDTGVGATESALVHGRARGVGISSVEHRLRCHYGDQASLHISSIPDSGTTIDLVIPIQDPRRRSAGEASSATVH